MDGDKRRRERKVRGLKSKTHRRPVISLSASMRISVTLFMKAKSGLSGNEATNSVMKPNCSETQKQSQLNSGLIKLLVGVVLGVPVGPPALEARDDELREVANHLLANHDNGKLDSKLQQTPILGAVVSSGQPRDKRMGQNQGQIHGRQTKGEEKEIEYHSSWRRPKKVL